MSLSSLYVTFQEIRQINELSVWFQLENLIGSLYQSGSVESSHLTVPAHLLVPSVLVLCFYPSASQENILDFAEDECFHSNHPLFSSEGDMHRCTMFSNCILHWPLEIGGILTYLQGSVSVGGEPWSAQKWKLRGLTSLFFFKDMSHVLKGWPGQRVAHSKGGNHCFGFWECFLTTWWWYVWAIPASPERVSAAFGMHIFPARSPTLSAPKSLEALWSSSEEGLAMRCLGGHRPSPHQLVLLDLSFLYVK